MNTDLTDVVPTRGESHLDHIFVRDVLYQHVKVIEPISKSDHLAIVAYSGEVKENCSKENKVCSFVKSLRNSRLHC